MNTTYLGVPPAAAAGTRTAIEPGTSYSGTPVRLVPMRHQDGSRPSRSAASGGGTGSMKSGAA
ncbi:hypothetical protein [Streptomyces sp. x-80]|uniref:hypothetical protein n=1 Tax=Streptomyces sp. x-80 TaxID=2789282 RepID=UPI00397F9BC2